jgi:hypothetical protein
MRTFAEGALARLVPLLALLAVVAAGDAGVAAVEPVPATFAGPDGAECTSAAIGAALAGSARAPSGCPADALAPADAASLRALVTFLAGRGVGTLAVAADASARSAAAAAVVRDAATGIRLTTAEVSTSDGALIVVSGWPAATATLADLARRSTVTYPAGTYLAPWLLAAPVLRAAAGAALPLRFDPRDDAAVRYEAALATRFPGEPPTASGYRAWLAARGTAESTTVRLYAASLVSFLPKEFAAHHAHHGGWLPGGTIVPVTGPLS